MNIRHIGFETLKPSLWDGGKTYQYYISPEMAAYTNRNFEYRISSALIEKAPSLFTRFDSYQRFLIMLDDYLEINRNGCKEVYTQHSVFQFDSSDEIISYSLGNDFNLMIKKGIEASVSVLKSAETQQQNLVLFSFEKQDVNINQQTFSLREKDCLIIHLAQHSLLKIDSTKEMILCLW